MNSRIYKIRRKSDGLFSAGGYSPSWTKKGKIWTTRAALTNHLAMCTRTNYKDCEIIEYEVVQIERSFIDLDAEFDKIEQRKLERTIKQLTDRAGYYLNMGEKYQLEFNQLTKQIERLTNNIQLK